MKWTIAFILALTGLTATAQQQSASGQATCRYISGDLPEIVGYGTNIHQARENASEQCFEQRASLYERHRGSLDEERGLALIDSCVNIRCS